MSVAKVMGILSFTTVVLLYNGTASYVRSYDGTTEGFRSDFNAVAPFHWANGSLRYKDPQNRGLVCVCKKKSPIKIRVLQLPFKVRNLHSANQIVEGLLLLLNALANSNNKEAFYNCVASLL